MRVMNVRVMWASLWEMSLFVVTYVSARSHDPIASTFSWSVTGTWVSSVFQPTTFLATSALHRHRPVALAQRLPDQLEPVRRGRQNPVHLVGDLRLPVFSGPLRGHPPVRADRIEGQPDLVGEKPQRLIHTLVTLIEWQVTTVPAKRLQLQSRVPERELAAGVLLTQVQRLSHQLVVTAPRDLPDHLHHWVHGAPPGAGRSVGVLRRLRNPGPALPPEPTSHHQHHQKPSQHGQFPPLRPAANGSTDRSISHGRSWSTGSYTASEPVVRAFTAGRSQAGTGRDLLGAGESVGGCSRARGPLAPRASSNHSR